MATAHLNPYYFHLRHKHADWLRAQQVGEDGRIKQSADFGQQLREIQKLLVEQVPEVMSHALSYPVKVHEAGNTRVVRVLEAIEYRVDHDVRLVTAGCMSNKGAWESDSDTSLRVEVARPLCRPAWRGAVQGAVREGFRRSVGGLLGLQHNTAADHPYWPLFDWMQMRLWPVLQGPVYSRLARLPLPWLRRRIQGALALDPALIDLARGCSLDLRRECVSQDRYTFVWQNADALRRIQQQTPTLLAPVASWWRDQPVPAGEDPTQAFRRWVQRRGVTPRVWRQLAHKGPGAFRAFVRAPRHGVRIRSLMLAMEVSSQTPSGQPWRPSFVNALYAYWSGSYAIDDWRVSLLELPSGFLAEANRMAWTKQSATALHTFLHVELPLVLDWVLEGGIEFDKRLRRAGWDAWQQRARHFAHHQRLERTALQWCSAIMAWEQDNVTGLALNSETALFDEGRTMRHCVYDQRSSAINGRSRFFSLQRKRQRATVELRWLQDNGWCPWQISGPLNRDSQVQWNVSAAKLAMEYQRLHPGRHRSVSLSSTDKR